MVIPLSTWVSEQVKDKQVHKGALLLKISTVLSLNIACQGEDCLLFWLYYRSRQDDTFELIRLAHNSFGVGRYRILLTTCIQAERRGMLFSYRIYSYFSFDPNSIGVGGGRKKTPFSIFCWKKSAHIHTIISLLY